MSFCVANFGADFVHFEVCKRGRWQLGNVAASRCHLIQRKLLHDRFEITIHICIRIYIYEYAYTYKGVVHFEVCKRGRRQLGNVAAPRCHLIQRKLTHNFFYMTSKDHSV